CCVSAFGDSTSCFPVSIGRRPRSGYATPRPCSVSVRTIALGSFLRQLDDLGRRFVEQLVQRVLRLAGDRAQFLHAATQLLADLRTQFALAGSQFSGALGGQHGLRLRQRPLEVVAGDGVLVAGNALESLQGFLLGADGGGQRVTIGLDDRARV